jgi:hypothetical protein
MQCAACLGVYADALDACPRCQQTPAPAPQPAAAASAMNDSPKEMSKTTPSTTSTLIEFPGVTRNRPAWRKELSERFREIQQRRAREAALEAEGDFGAAAAPENFGVAGHLDPPGAGASSAAETTQLGLVPPLPDAPAMNPIVAAALRRLERARETTHAANAVRGGGGRAAAAAVARVIEEQPEPVDDAPPEPVAVRRPESPGLVAVQTKQPEKHETTTAAAKASDSPAAAD